MQALSKPSLHLTLPEVQDAAQDQMQQKEQLIATDPPAAAYSPNRPLITNKSNKLEWQEGQPLPCWHQFQKEKKRKSKRQPTPNAAILPTPLMPGILFCCWQQKNMRHAKARRRWLLTWFISRMSMLVDKLHRVSNHGLQRYCAAVCSAVVSFYTRLQSTKTCC